MTTILDRLTSPEKKTLLADSFRQAVDGLLDTLKTTVFLLVAINLYGASLWQKSLISQSGFIGLLLSLFFTPLLEKSFRNSGSVLFLLSLPGGLLLILSSWYQSALFYSLAVAFSGIFLALRMPFFTGLYSENYQSHRRARLMSVGTLLFLFMSIFSNFLVGELLDSSLLNYRWIHASAGLLIMLNGFSALFIPGDLPDDPQREPFWKSLKLLWTNWKFGLVLFSWFLLGFANLWSLPLRTVYLGDPENGLGWEPSRVLLVLGVIPGVVKVGFNFIWANIYDKLPFIWNRILINFFLISGIWIFFRTSSFGWILLGAIMLNIALAGSPFIWNLWVTRIAPPGEIRKYMSVHTFLCGVRGILAPVLGFYFIESFSIRQVGAVSFVIGLTGSLLLIPLFKKKHRF